MSVRRLLLLLVALGASIGALVLVADMWLLPWIVHQQSEILVPDVVGLDRARAESALAEVGLVLVVGDEAFREGTPAGVVLEQLPASMDAVRRGRPVRVVVSRGETLVEVPDLAALSLRQTELALRSAGLVTGRVARALDPAGTLGVIGQRPHAGELVPRGTAVDLLLREGHERAWHRMPDLRGASLARVRDQLERAGFEVRRVTYERDREALPGTVLGQLPAPGARIPAGGSIELVASSRGR